MNSIHDLGGMSGMGPLPFEENEPVFHSDWERKVFGVNMVMIMTGLYVADEERYAMEQIPAARWLNTSYYTKWIDGFEQILMSKGIATLEELRTGKATTVLPHWAADLRPVEPDAIGGIAKTNFPVTGDAGTEPKFKVGDKVRARNMHPKTHTRLPRYLRGRVGTIESQPDAFKFADDLAERAGSNPKHVYNIRFEAEELWGPQAGPRDAVYIDLYEPYLEAV